MTKEIILLRGLFRSKMHWGDFPAYLQSLFPTMPVRCFDIMGNGHRFKLSSSTSIEAMVEDLRMQCAPNKQYIIIAMSMGGMIGIKWLERYPKEVASLVCINTSSKELSPFYQRLLPNNYFSLLTSLFSLPQKREKNIYQMTSNQPIDEKIIEQWVKYQQQYPMQISNFFRQLLAAFRFKAMMPKKEITFISSLQDKLVSHQATKALADAWNMPLILNHQDGHDIALDNPHWLGEVLMEILNTEPAHCS